MGLDTTHNCWHGAYSSFHLWREKLAECARIPLALMEGYWGYTNSGWLIGANLGIPVGLDRWLPISWDVLKPDPLLVLLDHSDSDGEIASEDCGPLADRLEQLLPMLPVGTGPGHIRDWRGVTQQFIDGLRLAASRGEAVEFH